MTERFHLAEYPKFTLLLTSHTNRKRLSEAKNKLLNIYPFEVEEKNLLIIRTTKKGKYDVYISNEEIKQNSDIKKIFYIGLIFVVSFCLLIIFIRNITIKRLEETKQLKEIEKQKLEQESLQREKEEKLEKLEAEYFFKRESEYEKIYLYIERIYSVMTDKTTIENISIDRNLFTVEVTTKDSVTILSNFEDSKAFNEVKMTRTNIKDEKEAVSYTGVFSRFVKAADNSLSVDEKIAFYTEELDKINIRSEIQHEILLSEYIKNIRTILHKHNCQEQYIQLRGKEKNAEIEFFVLSKSRNILDFINEIQIEENNLIDVKAIRIHNSEDRNKIQTTVCFDTGIELKPNEIQSEEFTDFKIEAAEINRIFYKATASKIVESKSDITNNSQAQKIVKMQPSVKLKKLAYIGLTKSNTQTFVLVKDKDMESIYKLLLTDKEIDGDCCLKTENGFKAKLRSEYYEVEK